MGVSLQEQNLVFFMAEVWTRVVQRSMKNTNATNMYLKKVKWTHDNPIEQIYTDRTSTSGMKHETVLSNIGRTLENPSKSLKKSI